MPGKIFSYSAYNVENELVKLKNTLVNSLIIGISVIAFPALLLAILSFKYSDSFPYISLSSYVIILTSLFFLNKIDYKIKTWAILVFGFVIGTTGLVTEGLLSDGFLYYVLLGVLSSSLIGTKAGIVFMLLSFSTSFFIAFLVHKKIIIYDFDTNIYSHAFPVWMTIILVTTFFTTLILIISSKINSFLFNTIETLSSQSEKLSKAKNELEVEVEQNKKMKHSLSESEKKFKEVFDSIEDAIIIFDTYLNLVDANKSFFTLSGYKFIKNLNLSELLDNFEKIKSSLFDEKEKEHGFYKNEINLKSLNKELIPVDFKIMPFRENLRLAVIRDIREKKLFEKQILNAIIQTEEKERTRISRDLHDCLGPLLSAVKMYSTSLASSPIDDKYQELSSKMTDMMDEAIKTVKEISNNLSSHILKNFGLNEALRSFSEKIQANYPVSIEIEFSEQLKITDECQITMYRVLVELMNNTLKYASAKKILIRVGRKNNKIVFIYKDDGIGFDLNKVIKERKGMGLFNINSRIKSLGGYVNIYSLKDSGTTVMIVI